jgi:hypothetical protein
MKDEEQLERNVRIRNCSTCSTILLDKGVRPSQCYKIDCWSQKRSNTLTIGEMYAEDVNVGESNG